MELSRIYPPNYEQRTIEVARRMLDDIPECAKAEFRVRFLSGSPVLILAFDIPETLHQPACAVRLVTISRTEPLKPGRALEGDRLRRVVRDAVEHYLAKHGVRIPQTFQEN